MSNLSTPARLRLTSIAAALAAALSLASPKAEAGSHPVTSCDDHGPGTLRAVVADAMTGDGDTIDLTPLKMVCSRITLDSEIDVHQNTLLLNGPGSKYLSVDGNKESRVFNHTGSGTLVISELTVTNGYYMNGGSSYGGCIYSSSSVSLISSVVSDCVAKSPSMIAVSAVGGGLYVKGNLTLLNSSLVRNVATSDGIPSGGGAVVRGDFQARYSTVDRNKALVSSSSLPTDGGGLRLGGSVLIADSTISNNEGGCGGVDINASSPHTATITNTTISGNVGTSGHGGGTCTSIPTAVVNSTIAFNRAFLYGGGVYVRGTTLDAESTIIANNYSSGYQVAQDVYGNVGSGLSGANDLIHVSTLALPMNTSQACPKLDVLADNGGGTLTHGLRPTSPAIDSGSAPMSLTEDQRTAPRVTGARADIGAVEWRSSDKLERLLASGFDGLCDQ